MMTKMLSLVSLMVLAATVLAFSLHGDNAPTPQAPSAPQESKLTAEVQAPLAQLVKTLNDQDGSSDATQTAKISQSLKGLGLNNDQAAAADITKLMPLVSQLLKALNGDLTDDSKSATTSTQSNGRNAGLQPSGGLVTPTLSGTPRLTNDQWRELFRKSHN